MASESGTQFLDTKEGRLSYEVSGPENGPVALAIPGMGDLRSEYRALQPYFNKAGYRFVIMDVRGFGETSTEWADVSARAVGGDATAILEHLGVEGAILLGNSFAAGSALWAASSSPRLVSKVVLLGPIVRDIKVSWAVKKVMDIGFGGPWKVWFWTTYWDSLFPTQKAKDHAQVKAAISKNLAEPGRMNILKRMIATSKSDTTAMLPSSQVPALIVMGTKDPDFTSPQEEAQWLAKELGEHAKEPIIVNGAGHYPHVEMADEVAPQIIAFCQCPN